MAAISVNNPIYADQPIIEAKAATKIQRWFRASLKNTFDPQVLFDHYHYVNRKLPSKITPLAVKEMDLSNPQELQKLKNCVDNWEQIVKSINPKENKDLKKKLETSQAVIDLIQFELSEMNPESVSNCTVAVDKENQIRAISFWTFEQNSASVQIQYLISSPDEASSVDGAASALIGNAVMTSRKTKKISDVGFQPRTKVKVHSHSNAIPFYLHIGFKKDLTPQNNVYLLEGSKLRTFMRHYAGRSFHRLSPSEPLHLGRNPLKCFYLVKSSLLQ